MVMDELESLFSVLRLLCNACWYFVLIGFLGNFETCRIAMINFHGKS